MTSLAAGETPRPRPARPLWRRSPTAVRAALPTDARTHGVQGRRDEDGEAHLRLQYTQARASRPRAQRRRYVERETLTAEATPCLPAKRCPTPSSAPTPRRGARGRRRTTAPSRRTARAQLYQLNMHRTPRDAGLPPCAQSVADPASTGPGYVALAAESGKSAPMRVELDVPWCDKPIAWPNSCIMTCCWIHASEHGTHRLEAFGSTFTHTSVH